MRGLAFFALLLLAGGLPAEELGAAPSAWAGHWQPSFSQHVDPADGEAQLEELKRDLLDIALDTRASVMASAWSDAEGALSEDIMVFSELNLAHLHAVPSRGAFGRHLNTLQLSEPTDSEDCAAQRPVRRQRIGVRFNAPATQAPAARNIVASARTFLDRELSAVIETGSMRSLAILASSSHDAVQQSAYRQFLTGSVSRSPDLSLVVSLDASPTTPILQRAKLMAFSRPDQWLHIEMVLQNSQGVLFESATRHRVRSSARDQEQQRAWLSLPDRSYPQLAEWVAEAAEGMAQAVGCYQGSAVQVAHLDGNEGISQGGVLQGGRDIGLYVGQELLLLPSNRRHQSRGLEATLGAMNLVRIVRVGDYSANFEVYAGTRRNDHGELMALPLSALSR